MHCVVFIYVLCVVFIYVSINKNYRDIFNLGGHSKSMFVEEKRTKTNMRGRLSLCIRSLLKKMLRFSKWSFIVILQFFLLIIMAAWNIKQTIMKDYNIQSCQWMAFDRFRQSFLLCTAFISFSALSIIFFAHFSKNGYLFIGYR